MAQLRNTALSPFAAEFIPKQKKLDDDFNIAMNEYIDDLLKEASDENKLKDEHEKDLHRLFTENMVPHPFIKHIGSNDPNPCVLRHPDGRYLILERWVPTPMEQLQATLKRQAMLPPQKKVLPIVDPHTARVINKSHLPHNSPPRFAAQAWPYQYPSSNWRF